MIRHYREKILKKVNTNQNFNFPTNQSIWLLPPYLIANFSGELIKVMADAAQQYIYQKSLAELKKIFSEEVHLKNPQEEVSSETSKKNAT